MLPGANTTAGKVAYGLGAILVSAVCIWQVVRTVGGGHKAVSHTVVCHACGAVEDDRDIPVGSDGALELPVKCSQCGANAAYLALPFMCPSCNKPIPVDPKNPPTECPHCGASLKDLFDSPAR